jgi:hypothetical protein
MAAALVYGPACCYWPRCCHMPLPPREGCRGLALAVAAAHVCDTAGPHMSRLPPASALSGYGFYTVAVRAHVPYGSRPLYPECNLHKLTVPCE